MKVGQENRPSNSWLVDTHKILMGNLIAAKIDDWDSFQAVKIEDESHARYLISAEKWRNRMAEGSFLREYENFLHKKK